MGGSVENVQQRLALILSARRFWLVFGLINVAVGVVTGLVRPARLI